MVSKRDKKRLICTAVTLIMIIMGSSPTLFAAELPTKYKGVTLRVIESETTPLFAMKELLPEFEKKTGIKVTVEVYDEVAVRDKMVLDFTSHTGLYDVSFLQWWFVPEYAQAGFIIPLDHLMETKSIPGLLNLDDFLSPILEGLQVGKVQYGIPYWYLGGMLYYRTDIFDKYGWAVPETIADTQEILDKFKSIKKQGQYDKIAGWVGRGSKEFDSFGSIAGFAWAYGSKLLNDAMEPTLLSDPRWKQAMNKWVSFMKDHGPLGAGNMTWYDAYNLFMEGKALMFTETSDYGADFTNPQISKVTDKAGFAVGPKGPAGNHIQWFYSEGFGINSDISRQKKEAAWLFIQWRCSSETQLKEAQLKKVGRRFDLCSSKVLQSVQYMEAARKAGAEDYAKGILETIKAADPSYWPSIPEFAEVAESVATQFSGAIAEMNTVKDALKNANDDVYRILEKAGYY